MIKLVAISDTHTIHDGIILPQGDVLVHAGDFTNTGQIQEIINFAEWMGRQPHQHKLLICGNHEVGTSTKVSEDTDLVKELVTPYGITLLHNEVYEIPDKNDKIIKFYGEPRTPEFGSWGWSYQRGPQAERLWDKVPDDIDVLICHGPPFGYGDFVQNHFHQSGEHVGCLDQRRMLEKKKPKLVICGHIHYDYGIHLTDFGTVVVNAAQLDEKYKRTNKPIVVNL